MKIQIFGSANFIKNGQKQTIQCPKNSNFYLDLDLEPQISEITYLEIIPNTTNAKLINWKRK